MNAEISSRKSLIEGVHMRCPRCEELFHIIAWRPFNEIEAYAKETTPVYKCRRSMVSVTGNKGCGFVFAPVEERPDRVFESQDEFNFEELIETEQVS